MPSPHKIMYDLDENRALTDKDYVHSVLHEQANQHFKHKKFVFKFPCHPNMIEVEKREDQYVQCPTCFKKYLMTFAAGNRQKLWTAS